LWRRSAERRALLWRRSVALRQVIVDMLAISILVIVVSAYIWKRWRSHSDKLPPGPFNIPLLGSWEFIKLYFTNGSLIEMYQRLGKRYGPVVFLRIAMDSPVVCIRGYEALKAASTDTRLAGMYGTFFYRFLAGFKNYGISLADGHNWRKGKKFLNRGLAQLGLSKESLEALVNEECSKALDEVLVRDDNVVNIEKALGLATTNIFFRGAYSRTYDHQDANYWEMKEAIATAFQTVAKLQTVLDFLPWLKPFNATYRKMSKALDCLYSYADLIINEHKATIKENNPRDLVDSYLLAAANAGEDDEVSTENLRVMIRDTLAGGLDTPSTAIVWAILLVAAHPQVQAKLHAELDSVIGRERAPSLDDEKSCPYTRAVIDETFRYFNLTPFNRHFATQGDTTFLGYHIPANSIILMDLHSMQHSRETWGDPENFRPERFLTEDGPRLREHVRPFGFSARVCPAEAYARKVVFLFVAQMFQRASLRLPEGVKKVAAETTYSITVRFEKPEVVIQAR